MAELAVLMKGTLESNLQGATAGYQAMGAPLPNSTIIKHINGVETMNLILVVRSVQKEEGDVSYWQGDNYGIPYMAHNLPVYLDLAKAATGDPTAFDYTNLPLEGGKQVFMPFNNRLLDPTTNAKAYIMGVVEVLPV